LGFNNHTCFQGLHAGADVRSAVNHHDAIRAAPDSAKHTTGFIAAGRVTMDHQAVAAQGDGNGFAFKPFHGLAVKDELNPGPLFKLSKYGMLLYSHGCMS
jgi:hypothetical protein